jgi:hypothetical protein
VEKGFGLRWRKEMAEGDHDGFGGRRLVGGDGRKKEKHKEKFIPLFLTTSS